MTGLPPVLPGPFSVRQLEAADVSRWESFVEHCPQATFFHRAGWREVIERSFGHRCYFLYAESEGKIQGVLPLGYTHSRLFSNALISSPFSVYGGVAAVSDEARQALERAACKLAEELRVDYLEVRNRWPVNSTWPSKRDLYVTFRKAIDPDPEVNLKAIPRKQRAMIRKGIEAGLVGEIDDDVERFYPVYAESVRNLGTPVFAKRYFAILREVFGEACEILTITRSGRPVAAVMSFYFRDEVLPYYGGGTSESREIKGNDFMYWDLMQRAARCGIRTFDYGRSKVGTGSYRFKKHWGFEPEPLYYEYHLIRSQQVPEINPLNPKYQIFINLWKRLPLKVSMLLGPAIVKYLG